MYRAADDEYVEWVVDVEEDQGEDVVPEGDDGEEWVLDGLVGIGWSRARCGGGCEYMLSLTVMYIGGQFVHM